jgi:uroporphyrinogen III methyltransferase/synthase
MPKLRPGTVHLVGAGPGAADLLTLRAADLLSKCDVLVYDYLANPEFRRLCRLDCEMVDVGKAPGRHSISQEDILAVLAKHAKEGKMVVRLKGGDPFVFGRGGEEKEALADQGIPVEITPGITAALGCAAHNGIPLTHRDFSSSLTFLTGHERPDRKEPGLDFRQYAKEHQTLCIYMGIGQSERISQDLMAGGLHGSTPVAIIRWGTLRRQKAWLSNLSGFPSLVSKNNIKSPALLVVGEAALHLDPPKSQDAERPLDGKRVVVTRSRGQAGTLRAKLEALGAEVLEIPLIDIRQDTTRETLTEVFAGIAQYEWILFTSSNGVRYFFDFFHKAYDDIRCLGPMRIAAIGEATAEEIRKHRLQIDLLPGTALAEELGKALLKKENVENLKVLVVTGNRNSPELVELLIEKGHAIVDELQVYSTDYYDPSGHWEAQSFLAEGADAVLFTSSSTVHSYVQHLSPKLSGVPKPPLYFSIGPKTTGTMKKHGIPLAAEAREASVDGLVKSLCKTL